MANFCTNCGTRLRKDDNYCINCGTKIDKSDMNPNSHSFKTMPDNTEKENAKKELKRVIGGGILFNQSFVDELLKNGLNPINTRKAIRKQIEKEIESGQIKSGGVEFRVNQLIQEYKVKNDEKIRLAHERQEELRKKLELIHERQEEERRKQELERKKRKEELKIQQMERRKQEEEYIRQYGGGYCGLNCRHYYEEFLDISGGIVGDFDSEGYVEYYCNLGHPISIGSFCKDYE